PSAFPCSIPAGPSVIPAVMPGWVASPKPARVSPTARTSRVTGCAHCACPPSEASRCNSLPADAGAEAMALSRLDNPVIGSRIGRLDADHLPVAIFRELAQAQGLGQPRIPDNHRVAVTTLDHQNVVAFIMQHYIRTGADVDPIHLFREQQGAFPSGAAIR